MRPMRPMRPGLFRPRRLSPCPFSCGPSIDLPASWRPCPHEAETALNTGKPRRSRGRLMRPAGSGGVRLGLEARPEGLPQSLGVTAGAKIVAPPGIRAVFGCFFAQTFEWRQGVGKMRIEQGELARGDERGLRLWKQGERVFVLRGGFVGLPQRLRDAAGEQVGVEADDALR